MKKSSSYWYIAITHVFTVVIAVILLQWVIGFSISIIMELLPIYDPVHEIRELIFFIVSPFLIWLAVKYSVIRLEKRYIIEKINQIIILSTVVMVVIGPGWGIFYSLAGNETGPYYHIESILGVIVFYFATKKYLNKTPKNGS